MSRVEARIEVAGQPPLVLVRPASAALLLDAAVARGAAEAPYWADLWPSAHALADHVAALPLAGRRVLELGCGLGLPALAAARAGALVTATDSDADALDHVRASAARNGLAVATALLDLADPAAVAAAGPSDIVLAADVLYDPALVAHVAAALPVLVAPAGEAIVAYPFAGQEAPLLAALAGALRVAATLERRAPGRRDRPTTIRLLRLRRDRASAATWCSESEMA